MPSIVPRLIECVRSVEGITPRYDNDQDKQFLAIFNGDDDTAVAVSNGEADQESDDEDEDEEDSHVNSVDIQTPFLDEKEDACVALGTIAKHTGALFLPYLEESYKVPIEA